MITSVYVLVKEKKFNSNKELMFESIKRMNLNSNVEVNFLSPLNTEYIDVLELENIYKISSETIKKKYSHTYIKAFEISQIVNHFFLWRKIKRSEGYTLIFEDGFYIDEEINFEELINKNTLGDICFVGKSYDSSLITPCAYILNNANLTSLKDGVRENLTPFKSLFTDGFQDHTRENQVTNFKICFQNFEEIKHDKPSIVGTVDDLEIFNYYLNNSFKPKKFDLYNFAGSDIAGWLDKYMNRQLLKAQYKIVTDEVIPFLFKFQMFKKDFCDDLLAEIENLNDITDSVKISLSALHIESMYKFILKNYIFHMAKHLWNLTSSAYFDENENAYDNLETESFITRGTVQKQNDVSIHHDGSFYTLIVCLNKDYEGGGIFFPYYKKLIKLTEPGEAIIFPGHFTHQHGERLITAGEKYTIQTFINQ